MRLLPFPAVLMLLALLLALPTSALAQEEPDQMVDPVEAMEPEIEVTAEEPAMPEVDGMVEVEAVESTPVDTAVDAPTSFQATSAAPSPSAQLPFTGVDSRQLLQLFLVGSVFLTGGIVSVAWARSA